MQYRNLGRTGLKVSALCLGTMTFGWSADEATSHAILDEAVAAGINFFDTADVYSRWVSGNKGGESETIIGTWLKKQDRRSVIIASKARGRMWDGPNGEGLSRLHILQAVEDSLRRLQTDYIDLYQTHSIDPATPHEETLRALETLVQQGKVRYVGASNYPAWQLTKALWVSDKHHLARFDSLQPHYSLFNRKEFEAELEPLCLDQGIGVIPYSPLAAGFLTGKYTREQKKVDTTRAEGGLIKRLTADDHAYEVLDAVREIAGAHDVPMPQVALAWLLARPSISSPIIGARTVEQLQEVVGAAGVTLTSDELEALTTLTERY
jgi:aryl-alcohol dehydrogenase-like predicted oxidoreductase